MSESILDRAVRAARADQPPRLDDAAARNIIDEAMAATPPTSRRTWWKAGFALAGVAAAIVLVLAFTRTRANDPQRPPAAAVVSDLILPTGDRIAATPGAQLEIANVSPEARRFRLTGGAAMFDVKPLAAGDTFVVHTPDSEISVVGTVFTVEVIAQFTVVRVYEGSVRVRRGERAFTLRPGEQLASEGAVARAHGDVLDVLASTRARERAASTVAAAAAHSDEPSIAASSEPSIPVSGSSGSRAAEPRRPSSASVVDDSEPVTPAVPAAPDPATPAQAIALLTEGKFDAARDLARAHGWHVIEGDAHRALGAHAEAAAAYERAIAGKDGDACVAALMAARMYAERLDRPERAVELLPRASDVACATRERALALTIQIATRIKRPDLGIAAARAYLADYPKGDQAAAARELTKQ